MYLLKNKVDARSLEVKKRKLNKVEEKSHTSNEGKGKIEDPRQASKLTAMATKIQLVKTRRMLPYYPRSVAIVLILRATTKKCG